MYTLTMLHMSLLGNYVMLLLIILLKYTVEYAKTLAVERLIHYSIVLYCINFIAIIFHPPSIWAFAVSKLNI